MEQNVTTILNNFTRKLANCHGDVPVKTLLGYFEYGMYGYSCEEGFEDVITNDYVLADDIADVIQYIKKIVKEPHIFLKKENVVQNIGIAKNYDTEQALETLKDTKLWSVRGDKKEPEFVHAYVNEDNIAIYENRFICALVDVLLDVVSKKVDGLTADISNINKIISGRNDVIGYKAPVYVEFSEETGEIRSIETSAVNKAFLKTYNLFLKNKKDLLYIKQRDFYEACRKAGKFDLTHVSATNILLKDFDYNYCYNFYLRYIYKKTIVTSAENAYFDYVLLNMMKSIVDQGFTYNPEMSVFITSSAKIDFKNLTFSNELLTLTLNPAEKSQILLSVMVNSDKSTEKYMIDVCNSANYTQEEVDKLALRYKGLGNQGYLCGAVISDLESKYDNTAWAMPEKANALPNITELLKSFYVIVEGSAFIYTRLCPVCGSPFTSPDDEKIYCANCESFYHNFTLSGKDLILIRKLPRITEAERKGISEQLSEIKEETAPAPAPVVEVKEEEVVVTVQEVEEPAPAPIIEQPIEEPAPAPIVEEPVVEEPVEEPKEESEEGEENPDMIRINRSFTGKLMQLDDKQKQIYADLKNYLLSFKKVNSRVSWTFDAFNCGRDQIAKLAVRGKTLVIFLALNPDDYIETKYFAQNKGNLKKFEETPAMFKVKSDRGFKFAIELIDEVMKGKDKNPNFVPGEYFQPYNDDQALVELGLAKYVKSKF